MTGVRTADWSAEVAPFWGAVIKSALTADGVLGLLRAGWCVWCLVVCLASVCALFFLCKLGQEGRPFAAAQDPPPKTTPWPAKTNKHSGRRSRARW